MSTYITLYNLTDQGIRNIREAPARIEEGIKRWEAGGGKMLGFYATLGPYDYVAITEADSDEAGAAFNLALGSLGNVRSTSLRAFTREEFADLVSRLPEGG